MAHPLYTIYNHRNRIWKYKGLTIQILPGVFHPGWFVSSQMLLQELESLDVKSKHVLELGCGTGTQACRAAQLGAVAYASDVSPKACKNAELNAQINQLPVEVLISDTFDEFPSLAFDFILVNPPFVPRYPELERHFAFYCGEQFEYYFALFKNLHTHLRPQGQLIIALAKSCACKSILGIAEDYGFEVATIKSQRRWAETTYLFRISFRS